MEPSDCRTVTFHHAGRYLIRAAGLWAAPGRIFRPGWLRIEGGRIVESGSGAGPVDPSAEVLDLDGVFLTPGLIDVHVHLDMDSGDGLSIARRAERASAAGVAAVRDGGDKYSRVLQARPSVQRHVRLAASGPAIHAPGRYGGWIGRAVANRADMTEAVAALAQAGVNQIKVMASGLVSLDEFGRFSPSQFELDDLRHLVRTAREHGLPVMAHANGPEAVSRCALAGVASVEHGYFMGGETLARLADAGTAWAPTIQCLDALARREPMDSPRRDVIRRTIEDQVGQLIRARELGVDAVVGTDLGTPGLCAGPALREEFPWWFKAGYTGEELLGAATAGGADLLRMADEVGRLTRGRLACVVGWPEAEPLAEALLNPPVFLGRPDYTE